MEHRYLMERKLGRKLHTDETVHHKNGNKLDNRLENLEVVGRAEHTAHHRKHDGPCLICGSSGKTARGLCSRHANRISVFCRRYSITVPADESARMLLQVGIALALSNPDDMIRQRMLSLHLSPQELDRFEHRRKSPRKP